MLFSVWMVPWKTCSTSSKVDLIRLSCPRFTFLTHSQSSEWIPLRKWTRRQCTPRDDASWFQHQPHVRPSGSFMFSSVVWHQWRLKSLCVDRLTLLTADKSTCISARWSKGLSWLQVVFHLTVQISLGECVCVCVCVSVNMRVCVNICMGWWQSRQWAPNSFSSCG